MRFILKWIVFAVALYLTFWTGQGIGLQMKPSPRWQENLWMSALVGFLNALVLPVVRVLLIPLNCLTLGIASVIVNSLLFWLLFRLVPSNFMVGNFWAALYGSVVIGVINGFLSALLLDEKRRAK